MSDPIVILPAHFEGTPDGERILQLSREIGWVPEADKIAAKWAPHEKISPNDDRLRSSLRQIAGLKGSNSFRLDDDGEPLLKLSQVKKRLGISGKQSARWREKGYIHPAAVLGKGAKGHRQDRPLYSSKDVEKWALHVADWQDEDRREREAENAARDARRVRLREALHLDAPGDAYPLARRMRRRIVFHCGPTNSGKTHAALERLASARTGLYAAPLRLLAMEGYDRLREKGVAAGLRTGEEEIDPDSATHLSSTIEALSCKDRRDVAVIDEIQLLADPDRGWAWTRALLGTPADEVHLAGSPDALSWIEAVLAQAGESVETITYERRSGLEAIEKPVVSYQAGDAIVVFSRRAVMETRNTLIEAGRSVSVVFGALPPEVRRQEAERFASGEAEILVATDAIGMGLNLPIRRVVFGALEKFDGYQKRPLSDSEIRQIAGRAGRGDGEGGYAGVARGLRAKRIAEALANPIAGTRAPAIRLRPEIEIASTGQGGWSALLDDVRSQRRTLPKGWNLDFGASIDVAAGIADAHEKASGQPASFCLSAPIGEDMHDVATRALEAGLAALRRGRHWPVPSVPASAPETDADMARWTDIGRELTLARWIQRRDGGGQIDAVALEDSWARYIHGLAVALASTDLITRACPECGDQLHPSHPHRLCDDCFFGDRFLDDDWI